jgi:hypothetical protein
MTLPESYPSGETPHEGPGEYLAPIAVQFEAISLLADMHSYRDVARTFDNGSVRTVSGFGSKGEAMTLHYYIATDHDETIAPIPYEELIWRPRLNTVAETEVTLVKVRFPFLQGPKYGLDKDAEPVLANDILLEVVKTDESTQRYLFNSAGIVPYRDASELLSTADVAASIQRPEVFSVQDRVYEVSLTPSGLRSLIQDCALEPQKLA